ncbi:MAG: protein-L-isoaspartate(D-aspartate) O-methyltransferase [Candidatus Sumerlaeota bacterium]|nr:protein-L-isoaspartate(D-aspartate) O-methyltransferase [Candidatus Sumerlaeota bacterium]
MMNGLRKLFGSKPSGQGVPEELPGAAMVREQIASRGITDERVLSIMARLDRRLFVAGQYRESAFNDAPLPTHGGQTISQPYIVAAMTEYLEAAAHHRVLEIGTGTGYQTAILAELVREVITVERDPVLARESAERLRQLGYSNVRCVAGDGFHGWPGDAPYDRILLTAAPVRVSPRLLDQLAPDGIAVAPEGAVLSDSSHDACQKLRRWRRTAQGLSVEDLINVRFVPLVEGSED